jgi:hypothetical protein
MLLTSCRSHKDTLWHKDQDQTLAGVFSLPAQHLFFFFIKKHLYLYLPLFCSSIHVKP